MVQIYKYDLQNVLWDIARFQFLSPKIIYGNSHNQILTNLRPTQEILGVSLNKHLQ